MNQPKITSPQGELIIRTTPMPSDTNYRGDIFGGWLMSHMDLAGGMATSELTNSRATTVAVNEMRFWNPVHVGDIVCVHASLQKLGRTSISFLVNAWTLTRTASRERKRNLVTEAIFTFVTIDKKGTPIPIDHDYVKKGMNERHE